MNIALFPSAFYPSLGGVEELTRQLALEFQRQGHRVIIVTNCWPRNLPKFERIDGLDVHRVPLRTPGAGIKSEISYRLTHAAIETKVAGLVRSFGADVIHVQCVWAGVRYAMEAARHAGLPIVVTLQGELTMDATRLFERSELARQVLRDALESAAAITACSRQTLDEAEAWYGKPFGSRGSVIYNGIAIDDAKAEPYAYPRPYVLAIGRHVPQKGFDVLLRAFARLTAEPGFDHDLIVAGDGTEHDALKRLAGWLAIGSKVKFTGRVDHAMAMKLFAGCSFFVLPSRHEPFGIVNLEAMAAGKAVIATCVGGVPEIVSDGVNGLLVPPEDEGALARAISTLAGSEPLRRSMGEAAAERAKLFEWTKIAGEYLSCYHEISRRTSVLQACEP